MSSNYLERADQVAAVAASQATKVDEEGSFPEVAMQALRESGLYGLISAEEVGGLGQGPGAAARVVARLAQACGSTAMVACMHYAGAAVIEAHGREDARRAIAAGEHLSTLAFSESGSRSHFWAPVGTAEEHPRGYCLNARKSFVTSAHHATAYVWSSRPVQADGMSTLWLVPGDAEGIEMSGGFDGLGLRGNDSCPVLGADVVIPESRRLGADGAGFDIMMGVVLPIFNLMTAAVSVGLMEAATERCVAHCGGVRHEHLDSALSDLATIRAYLARMRIGADRSRALLEDAIDAVEQGRDDAMLKVLEVKANAGDQALETLSTAMRVCGGAAFRKDVGVERYFRDARAGAVMAPTSDQLYDFIGRALCGMPLFDQEAS